MAGRINNNPKTTRTGGAQRPKREDSRRISSTIVKLLLVLALVLLLVALWRNRTDLSCGNISQCYSDTLTMCGSGDGFPSTINGSNAVSVDAIAGGGVALLSDTSLTVYDDTAMEAAVRAHFMSSPAMKTAGRYAVLIDLGSTDYRVESIAGTIATGDAENPLIGCAASRNCNYALVMQGSSRGESWLSSVEVFDRDGDSLHKWHCADWYITEAALSPDGKYLAVSGVNAAEGGLSSVIIIQKVGSSEQLAEYTLAENMYLSLEYDNAGTLFAFGTSSLTIVTDDGEKRKDVAYTGELLAFDVNYDSGAALCTADEAEDDACTVTIFDTLGRQRCSETIDARAETISLAEDACAAIGGGTLVTMRLDGTQISRKEANCAAGGLLLIDETAYMVDGIRVSSMDVSE